MKAFVTGATGFMGSAVVRELLREGYEVKALVRRSSDTRNLAGLDVERVEGDITDPDSVSAAMEGCQHVFHLAAMVYFWVPKKDVGGFERVNVQGTKNVLAAAEKHGVERVVYTSTISTIGSYGRENPTTEEHTFNLWDMSMEYERTKYSAEFEAWRYGARGLPLVVVLPSAPLGARDIKPNPIGKLILDFLARKVPGYIEGGGNFIDVDDVARGHVIAARKGRIGERYILGNQNLATVDLFKALEEISGIPAPGLKLPISGALGLAHLLGFVSNNITNKHPLLTPSLVKFSSKYYFVDTSKAEKELGFKAQTSIKEAALKAIEWFLDNGYIEGSDKKRRRIRQHIEGLTLPA